MKKIISLLFGLAMIYTFSSCSDEDYTSRYSDPSKTPTATCDRLMTGIFFSGARYTYNSYWRMYTWENNSLGRYVQTIGFTNGEGNRYSASDRWVNDRWEDFYKTLTQFRQLQYNYENLNDENKKLYRVFYCLSEIYIYDHLSQVIDAFGDVPFSEAGYLSITNDLTTAYPSYEKATDLYSMMLDKLGDLSTELNTLQSSLSSIVVGKLETQDFYNKGDLTKWIKYCNSLRLRLAVRVSSQGELSTKGKAVVEEILSNNYPLVDEFKYNIVALSDDGGVSSTDAFEGLSYGDGFRDGYKAHSFASQTMLDKLMTKGTSGQDDPRLVVMYSKNIAGEYKGLSTKEKYEDQLANTSIDEKKRVYSRIDSTTVIFNRNLKSPIINAAEVHFLKAEAYQKGWVSGDAGKAFVQGVLESVKFYYDQNNDANNRFLTTSPIRKVEMPAENDIIAFAEKLWNAAEDKEEVIITQKWLNFGFLQSAQAWNDYRRTGYPKLYFQEDNLSTVLKTPPHRMIYPTSERSYNATKYKEQVAKMPDGDSYYAKIFWAK